MASTPAPIEPTAKIKIPFFKRHPGLAQPLGGLRRWVRILGPGLVTGAADDDPSGIATYSQAGAAFGTGQLWLALYMLPMMITVQEMSGRIGLVTGQGIAKVLRKHYSRPVLLGAVMLVLVANTINIGADLGAMVAATRLLVPDLPFIVCLVGFALLMVVLEIFVPYRRYAVVLKVLTLSLLAYVVTGIIIGPSGWSLLRASIVPSIQFTPAFLALVVGVLGTTISPYLFFWQASEEVEELQKDPNAAGVKVLVRSPKVITSQLKSLRLDTISGMFASEVTTWFILFTTGSVLFSHGVTNITSADQAASALAPLVHSFPNAGEVTKIIFAVGILGVGLLAVPVLAGSAAYSVAEAFGWNEGLSSTFRQARSFYLIIGGATLVGMLLNLIGINPITALVITAVINGIVAVPLLFLILRVANNKTIMGEFTNGRLSNIIGGITTGAMGLAAVGLLVSLFLR